MSKKRQRINRISEVLLDATEEKSLSASITQKGDEDLFTIDRGGSKSLKQKIESKLSRPNLQSTADKALINKIKAGTLKTKKKPPSSEQILDIWGHSDQPKPTKQSEQISRKKCLIPEPGLSYNPSLQDHQNFLAQALANEIKLIEKEKSQDSLETQLAEQTTVDETSDNEELELVEQPRPSKPPQPKTKAERNKLKLRRSANHELAKLKASESILKAIDALPSVLSSLQEQEKLQETRRALKKLRSSQTSPSPSPDLNLAPLSDELSGSLRQARPKGISLREQLSSMQQRGEAMRKNHRKKRHWDNPHAGKRIKWIAKYKY